MDLDPNEPVTAVVLLNCFDRHVPKGTLSEELWDESDSKKARFRILQLKALFKAFEIRFDPERFVKGMFIIDRRSLYEPLVERFRDEEQPDWVGSSSHLPLLFKWLREYRRTILDARNSHPTFFGCDWTTVRVMHDIVEPAKDSVAQAIAPITDLLVELVSPERRTFRLEELIRDYGYPAENYRDLCREAEDAIWNEVFGDDNESDT